MSEYSSVCLHYYFQLGLVKNNQLWGNCIIMTFKITDGCTFINIHTLKYGILQAFKTEIQQFC